MEFIIVNETVKLVFDGILETRYNRGLVDGRCDGFTEGLDKGLRMGAVNHRLQKEHEDEIGSIGLMQGIEQGLIKGREEGLIKGQEEGFQKGHEEGLKKGILEGQGEGFVKGREEGMLKGLEEGMRKGREIERAKGIIGKKVGPYHVKIIHAKNAKCELHKDIQRLTKEISRRETAPVSNENVVYYRFSFKK